MARPKQSINHKNEFGLTRLWEEGRDLPRLSRVGEGLTYLARAWHSIVQSPLNSVLTILTVSVSLMLFGGFILFLENVQSVLVSPRDTFSMHVYLQDSASEEELATIKKLSERAPGVAGVGFRTKEQALKEFRGTLGDYASLLEGLEAENPLPASYEVKFQSGEDASDQMTELKRTLEGQPAVLKVQYRAGVLAQLVTLVRVLRGAGIFAVLFMFLMTGFIIATTIRLALVGYREEISIMRLVGAKESYVKSPFIIEGAIQGVCGGAISIGLVYLIFIALRSFVLQSPLLSYLLPDLYFLSTGALFVVILTGLLVGTAGSFFSVHSASKGD